MSTHRSRVRARHLGIAPLLGLLLLGACSSHGGADALAPSAASAQGGQGGGFGRIDLRTVRAELLETDRRYSAASIAGANLVDGLVNTLTADARYLPSGGPIVRGRDAVRALLATNPANASTVYGWTPLRVDVSGDGTLGYTYGYYQTQIPPVDGRPAATRYGKYVAAWRREATGWKVTALVRNPRPAGPVRETPPAGFESPDERHARHFPNHDPAATLESMMATDRAFSTMGERPGALGDAFAAFAAPDAALPGAGPEFVFGIDSIRADVVPPESTISFSWAPTEGEVAGSADLGYTIGIAPVRDRATGELLGYSKYLTVWQRQQHGEWRYVVDGGSGMPIP